MAFNANEVKQELMDNLGGMGVVEVGPSNVYLSPHDYVFVWLTDKQHEGPHAIVSDVREYDDHDGYVVGVYAHHEAPGNNCEEVATVGEAVARTKELIEREAWQ